MISDKEGKSNEQVRGHLFGTQEYGHGTGKVSICCCIPNTVVQKCVICRKRKRIKVGSGYETFQQYWTINSAETLIAHSGTDEYTPVKLQDVTIADILLKSSCIIGLAVEIFASWRSYKSTLKKSMKKRCVKSTLIT